MPAPFPIDALPTFEKLGLTASDIPPAATLDIRSIATNWLTGFSAALSTPSTNGINAFASGELLHNDAWWRDMLALTWNFRTFRGIPDITQFLLDRPLNPNLQPHLKIGNVRLVREDLLKLENPFPDLAWIKFMFEFDVGEWGAGVGVVRLVPLPGKAGGGELTWKAHTVYTFLESLHNHPEQIGARRNHNVSHGDWVEKLKIANEYLDRDPKVLIIGAGHNGLQVAARLKALSVDDVLIVDKNKEVGDNWRGRYEALALHDPVWCDHLAYFPFPPQWPVFPPAAKLAQFLKTYAEILEINVWTSTTVKKVFQAPGAQDKWTVVLTRKYADGTEKERTFVVDHVVFAIGYGSGVPNMPNLPGKDKFKGEIIHSTQYQKASHYKGKKVVVVGACTAAHDIAEDCARNGVDVTMYQRSPSYIISSETCRTICISSYYEGGPPADECDRLGASLPLLLFSGLAQRIAHIVNDTDKKLLEGLKAVGFRTHLGIQDTGIHFLFWTKCGGYYIDTGASGLIISGDIKLISGENREITSFSDNAIQFSDNSAYEADVVIFATGFGDAREGVSKVLQVANKEEIGEEIWGLNEEGEFRNVWRDTQKKGIWYMLGNFAFSRYHSKHVALQIKARLEGSFTERYTK